MNVSLTKELEGFVEGMVSSGMYYSASEVVREGLRLLKEQEDIRNIRREELRREIELGAEDLRAGRKQTFDSPDAVLAEVQKRGRKRLAQKENGHTE